jgi:hypothetical protein
VVGVIVSVVLSMVYAVVFGLVVLGGRGEAAKDVELLVLRHEVMVPSPWFVAVLSADDHGNIDDCHDGSNQHDDCEHREPGECGGDRGTNAEDKSEAREDKAEGSAHCRPAVPRRFRRADRGGRAGLLDTCAGAARPARLLVRSSVGFRVGPGQVLLHHLANTLPEHPKHPRGHVAAPRRCLHMLKGRVRGIWNVRVATHIEGLVTFRVAVWPVVPLFGYMTATTDKPTVRPPRRSAGVSRCCARSIKPQNVCPLIIRF